MKLPNIKDIAKIAGVSHGTVSNVLNARGNVSVEKIEAVMRAAKEMGYQLNAKAQSLRAATTDSIAVVLPNIKDEQYNQLYQGIWREIASSLSGSIDLYLTDDLPSEELAIIRRLVAHGHKYIITVSCLNNEDAYYQSLRVEKENILFVYRIPKGAAYGYSLDFSTAAKDIATDIVENKYNSIGLLCDNNEYSHVREFANELSRMLSLQSNPPQLIVRDVSNIDSYKGAFDFFSLYSPDVLIATDNKKYSDLIAASYFGSKDECPPIYVLSDNNFSDENVRLRRYKMDYARLGSIVAKVVKDEGSYSSEGINYIKNKGFAKKFSKKGNATPTEPNSLNLLTLPSPSTEALKKILPLFRRNTGVKVNLTVSSYGEIFDILSNIAEYKDYDIIRLDMAWLPWFAESALTPLHEVSSELSLVLNGYSDNVLKLASEVNHIAYAVPLDIGAQMLFYRRDLFDDIILRRKFFETNGWELRTPENYSEFDTISRFFSLIHQSDNTQRPMGSSSMLGSPALIASEYLSRYYAMGGRLMHEGSCALLEKEIAVPALQQYIENLSSSYKLDSDWWSASVDLFEQGKLAMQIAYMNLFNDVAQGPLRASLAHATVPGGQAQLGGGTLGVSKYSKKKFEISSFIQWLHAEDVIEHRVLLGMGCVHESVYHNQRLLQHYPWIPMFKEISANTVRESHHFDGTPFNLRQAETIIGTEIKNAIADKVKVNIYQIINRINSLLAEI